jgi:hypothetical protein
MDKIIEALNLARTLLARRGGMSFGGLIVRDPARWCVLAAGRLEKHKL